MGTITFTSTTTAVILTDSRVDFGSSRNVVNYVFADGTDIQSDEGKSSDYITISGFEFTAPYSKMYHLQEMMNEQEEVTLSGMADSNLNEDYLITDIQFDEQGGQVDRYNWSITIERKYDTVG